MGELGRGKHTSVSQSWDGRRARLACGGGGGEIWNCSHLGFVT